MFLLSGNDEDADFRFKVDLEDKINSCSCIDNNCYIVDSEDLCDSYYDLNKKSNEYVYLYYFILYNKDCFQCTVSVGGSNAFGFYSLKVVTLASHWYKTGTLNFGSGSKVKIIAKNDVIYFVSNSFLYKYYLLDCDDMNVFPIRVIVLDEGVCVRVLIYGILYTFRFYNVSNADKMRVFGKTEDIGKEDFKELEKKLVSEELFTN